MSLSVGIVGLPNVGKSTLFNALTEQSVPAENYPFCTIDPSVGVVAVPDPRLEALSKISGSQKIIPAVVEFTDIAGLVAGASEGEGLGNKFLAHIRETDAICEMVRVFDDENIVHVAGKVDPLSDIQVIELELAIADLQTVEKRRETLSRDVKRGDDAALLLDGACQKLIEALKQGKLARTVDLSDKEREAAKDLHLLTMKPVMYCLNKKSGGNNIDELNDGRWEKLKKFLDDNKAVWVTIDASTEKMVGESPLEERAALRAELGVSGDGLGSLTAAAYRLLDRISYLTTGEIETRAWTIRNGAKAPEAGAAIHNDFAQRFIRAEVVACADLLAAGSYAAAREKGLVRTEGKEYVVKDGDVIEFKI